MQFPIKIYFYSVSPELVFFAISLPLSAEKGTFVPHVTLKFDL